MAPQRPRLVLLTLVGLLLLANPLWLFPHEGDTRYTYERSEIGIQNGTLVYEGADLRWVADEANSLNAVACQPTDDEQSRACAFDHHLVDHSAVTVPREQLWTFGSPEGKFVRIDGTYYRRIQQRTGTGENRTVTYAVERVTPRTVLAESAHNISGLDTAEDLRLEYRVAITGNSVTTFRDLGESELGNVYRRDGSYYTVVKTDRKRIDHGLGWLQYQLPRYVITSVGIVLVVGAFLVHRTKE